MLRILRSELFNGLMQALLLVSLYELFFGNGYVNSGVVYAALVVSSFGTLSGLLAISTAPKGKRKLG